MDKIKKNMKERYIPCIQIFLMCFVICFMLLFAGIARVSAVDHPFLIVNESDYAELQARATNSPWKEMKTEAISYVNNRSYDPSNKISSMRGITSAGALAYILDPTNRTAYKNTVRDALKHWDDIYADRDSGWFFCVRAGSAFFNSVLALDIIHDDLTSAERAEIEGKLDPMAEWYWSGGSSYWPLNRYGVIGVWALYQGDRNRINSAKNSYYSKLMSYLTTDGVFTSGSGYAWAGLSSNRDAKAYFMDVLEFTGEGTYYSDRKVRKFYEWLYRGASTPFYKNPTFGDSDPHRNVEGQWGEAAGYRAHRFSVQAAQNAAWMVNGVAPNARLLNYVLMDQPLPPAGKPLSGIWPDGCAAFWEDNTSSRSLMGVLWNWKSDYSRSHAHKDVNALHLAAYGEHVLRNSGYTGWGQGAYGFSWSYIHDTAVSGNTVHIDNLDHVRKDGGGILEGFTMPRFDYACGYSGNALSNGKHWRSFVFVHPQDDRNGYWVLFDEVDADNSSSSVNTALHPNSDDYSTVSDKLEYRWQIGPHTYSGHDVFLTIFLGTTPNTVELKDGLLAGFDGTDFVGKYLYATYDTDGNGKRNIVTVLFPHDGSHAKATIARVSGGGYTGVSIDLGGYIVDTALESSGTDVIAHSGVSFRGLASLYRRSSGNITFYFVREGRFFDDCTSLHRGFSSNSDVSVYMKDKQGKIISPGTDDVTFYYPGISAVLLGGVAAPVVESTAGWIKVTVASGTHELEFLTGGTVPLSAST